DLLRPPQRLGIRVELRRIRSEKLSGLVGHAGGTAGGSTIGDSLVSVRAAGDEQHAAVPAGRRLEQGWIGVERLGSPAQWSHARRPVTPSVFSADRGIGLDFPSAG